MIRRRIEELVWDEWNEVHISRHGVTPDEVEEAVFGARARFFRARQDRLVVLGVTMGGRALMVVLAQLPGARAYVITARNMTRGERRRWRHS